MITTTTSKECAKMNRRNTPNDNRMIEFDAAYQMQNQQRQEPYILLGNPPNFPHPNAPQITPASVINTFDFLHLPEHHDGTSLYRPPQYGQQAHPVTNLELAIPSPSNFYNPYFCPASAHHIGYGMNAPLPDGFGVGGSSKISCDMGNAQYMYAAAAAPMMNPMLFGHADVGFPVMDSCFPMPEYGGHIAQSFGPPAATWCDPQPDYRVSTQEIGICGGQRYNDGASTSQNFQSHLHYTHVSHSLHGFYPPRTIQGASRNNVSHRPPAATTSGRNPNNNNAVQYLSTSHRQQAPEPAGPHNGIRVYRRPQRRGGYTPQSFHRHHDLPNLRLLPEEGVAILEFSGDYEVSNDTIDHHSDMRLDIDYMSYEELLALSEHIGSVKTGLSEEVITTHLKTRVHKSSMDIASVEQRSFSDEKNDSCVICQDEYADNDKIGSLECGHEYHVQCLKKWLPVKNVCPICKSTALNVDRKSG